MEWAKTLKSLAKPVTDAASDAASSAEEAFVSSELLNEIVDEFRNICETCYANLEGPAMAVCFALLMIEFATDWTLYDFFLLINNWDRVICAVEDSFVNIATVASGAGMNAEVVEPSDILNQGFRICKDLFAQLTTAMGRAIEAGADSVMNDKVGSIKDYIGDYWDGLWIPGISAGDYADLKLGAKVVSAMADEVNPMQLLCTLIAIFMIIFAHLWIALELFLCYIEYYIFAGLATILLPFGVFRHTKFIFDRTVQGMLNFGMKILGAVFLICIAQNSIGMMDDSIVIEAEQEFSYYLRVSLLYLCVAFLIWKLPEKFAGLMAGHGPSISGGEAVGGALAAAGIAAGGVTMVAGGVHTLSMATRADIRDPSKGSTYNPIKIAGNLAELTSARIGSSITRPWRIGAANSEMDVNQWDAFMSGNYQNLRRDF